MAGRVSVIIPTKNSSSSLDACLSSISAQTYRDVETIVVDGRSDDGTADIAKRHSARLLSHPGERTAAKNLGLERASGEFVCFIDSDMVLDEGVLGSCVSMMGEGIGGVIIPEDSVGDSFWVRVRDFERRFYEGSAVESARFFRRDLAWRAGGFDEDAVSFEEKSLPERISRMGFDVEARVVPRIDHLEYGFSIIRWLGKKYYYGKTMEGGKHMDPVYRAGLFLRDLRFYSSPMLAIGLIILKSLESAAALLGYIAGKNRVSA